MPSLKLTRRNVDSLPPSDRPVVYFDTDLRGFGLRVMPSGVRAWIVEYRPGEGGRRVAKRRLVLGRANVMAPEEARKRAAEVIAAAKYQGVDAAAGRTAERKSLTVGDLADRFMSDHVRVKRKPKTAESYSQLIAAHIKPAIGSKKALHLTRAEARAMHSRVSETSGPYAANRALAVLSAIFGWASKYGDLPSALPNPARGIERFGENPREAYLTPDQLARLGSVLIEAETVGLPIVAKATGATAKHTPKSGRREVLSPHATGAIRLLLLTGARLREILSLEWDQVDLGRGLLFLPDSKTGKKTIVLSSPAISILTSLPRIGRYVIAGRDAGTPEEKPRADLNRPWRSVASAAGLKGVRLHDLRHTFGSVGAGSGIGLPVIGRLLGHTDTKTTQRYATIADNPARAAADAIGAEIAAAMGYVQE